MKTLLAILKLLWQLFFPPKKVSIVPSLPTDPITGALDVAAIAGELGITTIQVLNSPEMVAGRYNVSVQHAKDLIAKHNADAMKTGDVTEVDKDLA